MNKTMLETIPTGERPSVGPQADDWRKNVPSVSQLTRSVRGHIENAFFDVFVKGEISNFRRPASGHGYFILKDASSQVRGVIFRNVLSRLRFALDDGMEVILHGKLTVYEARGDYQIVCDSIEPMGRGALQLAFEQLKAKLQKEGLFAQTHKKPLPSLPKRIGVVTSATGAAVRDTIKVLHRRFSKREIVVIPTSVQGEKATEEIVSAIYQAEQWNVENPDQPIEVLIVGRGGGSIEDLWCFNEEVVARAIFECKIPIISAVGHEIDFTIADFVADVRAATPSAAAELVLPAYNDLLLRMEELRERLAAPVLAEIEQLQLHIGHLSRRLIDPRTRLNQHRERLGLVIARLVTLMRHTLERSQSSLQLAADKLDALSPLSVLHRGYSLTSKKNGTLLRHFKDAPKGTEITTRLHDGVVHSKVLSSAPNPS